MGISAEWTGAADSTPYPNSSLEGPQCSYNSSGEGGEAQPHPSFVPKPANLQWCVPKLSSLWSFRNGWFGTLKGDFLISWFVIPKTGKFPWHFLPSLPACCLWLFAVIFINSKLFNMMLNRAILDQLEIFVGSQSRGITYSKQDLMFQRFIFYYNYMVQCKWLYLFFSIGLKSFGLLASS